MKNRILLEIREASEQVCFAAGDFSDGDVGLAKLFTEEEAIAEWGRLRQEFPNFKFQIVVLRLGEEIDYDGVYV